MVAANGLLITMYRDRGLTLEPRRPLRTLMRHDTKVVPRAKFFDENGVAILLTGLTIRYTLRDDATGVLVVNRQTATAENQTTNPGEAFYAITTGQVANALEGDEEWTIDHGAGGTETFPVGNLRQRVRIVEDVDAT